MESGANQERDPEPIEDILDYSEDDVDFMSAESFPASDPPPPPSAIAPAERPERE